MTKAELSAYHKNYYAKNREKMLAKHRQWSANNKDKIAKYRSEGKLKHTDYLLKRKFGISLEEYEILLERQGGTCALCTATTAALDGRKLAVDHCHTTGKVRGLLCGQHNTAIGSFKDDLVALQKAIDYLKGA